MQEKRLLFYYPDPYFVSQFAAYLEQKTALSLRCHGFEKPEDFYESLAKEKPDLVLLPAGESLPTDPPPHLFFTERSEAVSEEELPIFRSMERQIRSLRHLLDLTEDSSPRIRPDRGELIGFYSPVHGAGQSISAILMGMVLAEKAPTLLINLERFSGLSRLLPRGEGTLSDLLYYAKVQGDLGLYMEECTEYFGPLALVPPAAEPGDLKDMRPEDLKFLLSALLDQGKYRYILVDWGEQIPGEDELLSLCSRLYVPIREDALAFAKLKEWQAYLEGRGRGELIRKMKTYRLPPPAPGRIMEYRELRHLSWGKTIRALAEGDE